MALNDAGDMINFWWKEMFRKYPNISIDEYIIMPNHIHGIINIVGAAPRGRPLINTGLKLNNISNKNRISDSGPAQGPAPTGLSLSDIIYRFKSLTTKHYIDGVKNKGRPAFNKKIWQRSFHDHIIRNDKSLHKIREYIVNNPATWDNDKENINCISNISSGL